MYALQKYTENITIAYRNRAQKLRVNLGRGVHIPLDSSFQIWT